MLLINTYAQYACRASVVCIAEPFLALHLGQHGTSLAPSMFCQRCKGYGETRTDPYRMGTIL